MRKTAIVIGGGPAGASAALGLLRQKFNVTLLEKRDRWTGRVCGCFLNPEAVRHLDWLGVLKTVQQAGAVQVDDTDLCTAAESNSRIVTRQLGLGSLGLPRQKLEGILLHQVQQEGGDIHPGTRVLGVEKNGDEWTVQARSNHKDETFSASLVVLADGRFSLADPEPPPAGGWYGWNAAFRNVDQFPGKQSLHFWAGRYIGVMTFSDGSTNVCGLTKRKPGAPISWPQLYEEARATQNDFRHLMRHAERTSDWKGVGPLPFSTSMRQGRGLILAGDAAAVGDPFMGEGIGRALGAGPMIYDALDEGSASASASTIVESYERLWKRTYSSRLAVGLLSRHLLGGPFFGMARRLLASPKVIQRLTPLFHVGYTGRI